MLARRLIDLSSFQRITLWSVLITVFLWCIYVVIINVGEKEIKDFLFLTNNPETYRYMLSSSFQGLAALFALSITASLAMIQITFGTYSTRIIRNIAKDPLFISGVFLYVSALSSSFFLLSFINEQTLVEIPELVFFNNILTIISVVYIVPLVFSIVRETNPMKIGADLVSKFDGQYFSNITNSQRTQVSSNDTQLPLLQTMIIQSIMRGDNDLALKLVTSFGYALEDATNDQNGYYLARYTKYFFKKIIWVSFENQEDLILSVLIEFLERLQKKSASDANINRVERYIENEILFVDLLVHIGEQAIIRDNQSIFIETRGALTRIRGDHLRLIKSDDEIAHLDFLKTIRTTKSTPKQSTNEQYANERTYEFVRDKLFLRTNFNFAYTAIKHNPSILEGIIRDISYVRFHIKELDDNSNRYAKEDIWSSLIFGVNNILYDSVEKDINVISEIAAIVQDSIIDVFQIDTELGEYMGEIVPEALRLLIEKKLSNSRVTWVFHEVGIILRKLLREPSIQSKKTINEIINTLIEILDDINHSPKKRDGMNYTAISKEIIRNLETLENFGLAEKDASLNAKVDSCIKRNKH